MTSIFYLFLYVFSQVLYWHKIKMDEMSPLPCTKWRQRIWPRSSCVSSFVARVCTMATRKPSPSTDISLTYQSYQLWCFERRQSLFPFWTLPWSRFVFFLSSFVHPYIQWVNRSALTCQTRTKKICRTLEVPDNRNRERILGASVLSYLVKYLNGSLHMQ